MTLGFDEHMGSKTVCAPEYVITLVHGTFARGARWTGEGSRLREVLTRDLRDVRFESFLWSGHNSHTARLDAGQELARFLKDRRKEYPTASHLVIAHSHGGNVALYALRGSCDAVPIEGLVCLATPFLDCIKRKLENTLAILTFVMPGYAFLGTFMICAVAITLITGDFSEAEGGLLMAVLSVPFAVAAAVRLAQRTYNFVTRRLPGWIGTKAEAICLRLKPPIIRGMPIFVATLPKDEAALWLRTFQNLSAIPFRLWQIPSAIARRVLESWPSLLLAIGVVVIACAVIQNVWSIPTEKVGMAIYMAIAFSVLTIFQIAVVMILMMVFIPKFVHASPLVFGWEALLDNLVVNISANPLPAESDTITHFAISTVPSRWKSVLRHSAVYGDDEVLSGIVDWIKQHIESGTRAAALES